MKFITSVVIAVSLMFAATLAHAGKYGEPLAYQYLDGMCSDETVIFHGILNNATRNQIVICGAGGIVYFSMGTSKDKGINFQVPENEVLYKNIPTTDGVIETVSLANPNTGKIYTVGSAHIHGAEGYHKGQFNIMDYTGKHVLIDAEVFRDTIIMAAYDNLNKGSKL